MDLEISRPSLEQGIVTQGDELAVNALLPER
jgi:hypothetical protein